MFLYLLPVNYFMEIGMIRSYSSPFTNEEHRLNMASNGANIKSNLVVVLQGLPAMKVLLCSFHAACAHPTTSVKTVKLDHTLMMITISC